MPVRGPGDVMVVLVLEVAGLVRPQTSSAAATGDDSQPKVQTGVEIQRGSWNAIS